MTKKIIGEYSSFYTANNVAHELMDYGLAQEQIDIFARSQDEVYRVQFTDEKGSLLEISGLFHQGGVGLRLGVAIGTTAGLLSGLLATLATSATPTALVGVVSVAAWVGAGAFTGAFLGRAIGMMISFGIPEEETRQYLESVRQGGVLVAVQAETYHLNLVRDVMSRYRPENIDEQAIAASS